jgi:hypothetical protein
VFELGIVLFVICYLFYVENMLIWTDCYNVSC